MLPKHVHVSHWQKGKDVWASQLVALQHDDGVGWTTKTAKTSEHVAVQVVSDADGIFFLRMVQLNVVGVTQKRSNALRSILVTHLRGVPIRVSIGTFRTFEAFWILMNTQSKTAAFKGKMNVEITTVSNWRVRPCPRSTSRRRRRRCWPCGPRRSRRCWRERWTNRWHDLKHTHAVHSHFQNKIIL